MNENVQAKQRVFLLLWQDLHRNVKDLILSLVVAVFNDGDTDRIYYEISRMTPALDDLRITKTKVYGMIAAILDISPRTAFEKLNGKSDFTLNEVLALMSTFDFETLDNFNIILKEIRKGFENA